MAENTQKNMPSRNVLEKVYKHVLEKPCSSLPQLAETLNEDEAEIEQAVAFIIKNAFRYGSGH